MNYRSSVISHRLSVVKLGLSLLALAICATVVPAQTKRPNILWISTEDISPDLGCYGDPYAVTPSIDRLAAQGVRYSKTDYNFEPPPQPGASGMRAFNPPPPDTLWDESSNTAHWRNRADKSQPFFAVFNIMVTHESQVRAPDEQYKRNTARLKPEQFHDPAKAALPPYYPDTPLVRKDWARYYDNITAMDYLVADLLNQLEEDGLAENTVVFFWGDHGRGLPRSKRFVYDSGLRVPLIARWPGQIQPGTTNDELVCLFDLGPTALSLADAPIPAHMQAQAILGPQKKSPRQFAFAHRDRMDEAYDMSRSVMGKQFHYIRNFHPDRPYFQYLDYLEEMPTMKEWRRLYKDHMNALDLNYGKALNPAQLLFIGPSKPPEELYDVKADPHEIHNLADDPQHQATLKQMRAALDKWQKDTKDLGSVPELELRERMRPGGVWQRVAAPRLNQTANGDTVKVKLSCATEGSSIAYTTDGGAKPHWLLYIDELTLKRGATLRFKACRLGYLDSQEGVEKF